VLVEALEEPRSPLWGDAHAIWPWPEWEPYDRVLALAGPAYKGFARAEGRALTNCSRSRVGWCTGPGRDHAGGLGYLELTAPGVTKGTGLAVVAEELGIGPRTCWSSVTCPTDVPMFEWARWRRVAVANAHPEILALADEVTASNDADGVAAWLEAMLSH
jgi:hypothetical protein